MLGTRLCLLATDHFALRTYQEVLDYSCAHSTVMRVALVGTALLRGTFVSMWWHCGRGNKCKTRVVNCALRSCAYYQCVPRDIAQRGASLAVHHVVGI